MVELNPTSYMIIPIDRAKIECVGENDEQTDLYFTFMDERKIAKYHLDEIEWVKEVADGY